MRVLPGVSSCLAEIENMGRQDEEQMADTTSRVETDRRNFLKFAGLGGVAGGVTLLTSENADATEAAGGEARSGYAETEHVKAFYRSARF